MKILDLLRILNRIKKKDSLSDVYYYDSSEGVSKITLITNGYVLKELENNHYKDSDVLKASDIVGKEDQYKLIIILG